MFRSLLTLPRNRGTLVSSTPLVRAWQNESTRQEAKIRHIFIKRNKTTFISTKLPAFRLSFAGSRQASTAVNESVRSPASPVSAAFLDVKIPYLPQSDPQPLVQIPYVPDFWDSSSPIEPIARETLPKILVVAGAGTHHGGGPSHNLLDISSGSENSSLGSGFVGSSGSRPEERGLWDDMADDIGLPPTEDVKNAIWKLFS